MPLCPPLNSLSRVSPPVARALKLRPTSATTILPRFSLSPPSIIYCLYVYIYLHIYNTLFQQHIRFHQQTHSYVQNSFLPPRLSIIVFLYFAILSSYVLCVLLLIMLSLLFLFYSSNSNEHHDDNDTIPCMDNRQTRSWL